MLFVINGFHERNSLHSQNVGDDADAPQVGGQCDGLLGRHLRRAELGRRVLGAHLTARVVPPRAAKVDDLYLI